MEDLDNIIAELSRHVNSPAPTSAQTGLPTASTPTGNTPFPMRTPLPPPARSATRAHVMVAPSTPKPEPRAKLDFSNLSDLVADLVGDSGDSPVKETGTSTSALSPPLPPSSPTQRPLSYQAQRGEPDGVWPPRSDWRMAGATERMRDAKSGPPSAPLSAPAGGTAGSDRPAADALDELLIEQEQLTRRRATFGARHLAAGVSDGPRASASRHPVADFGGVAASRPAAAAYPEDPHHPRPPSLPPARDQTPLGPAPRFNDICPQCGLPAVGTSFMALGRVWHPDCFVCRHCGKMLGSMTFFEKEGFPYCMEDYHELFSPRCAYCAGVLTDQCIMALGKSWHADHFLCCMCGKSLRGDVFHEHEGKAYCEADYLGMFAPKCGACGKFVLEENISALGKTWHPRCFVCKECKQPFAAGTFFESDGNPYCEIHFHAKKGSLCGTCQKPIVGRCVTAIGKRFHPEHFVCQYCARQLSMLAFKQHNAKPYCMTCYVKLHG